jgi:RNA polymerase sigma-70 factor (ECF subfamily)
MEPGREAGLLLAAQRGELPAFFELLRAHQRPLWHLCMALTRHRGESELLVQETSRRAWKNIRQARVGQPFFPWLVRMVRSFAVAQERRRAGERRLSVGALRPDGKAWESGGSGAHELGYEYGILAAFAELSVDEQILLALRLFERLPYAEISTTVELSLTATMHRIATIRERLEVTLQKTDRAA